MATKVVDKIQKDYDRLNAAFMSYSNQITPDLIRFLLAITTGVPFLLPSSSRLSIPSPTHSLTRLRQNISQNSHNKPSTAKQGRHFSPNKSQMNYGASEFLTNVQHKFLIRISLLIPGRSFFPNCPGHLTT